MSPQPVTPRTDYALGYVTGDDMPAIFVSCMWELQRRDLPSLIAVISGPNLVAGRNELVRRFMELPTPFPKLVIVDTDMVFSPAQVDGLLASEAPIASGVYLDGSGKIVKDGAGFMAVRREVFEALGSYPFNTIELADGRQTSEDIGFRRRAKQKGFAIEILNIEVGHIKPFTLWPDGQLNKEQKAGFDGPRLVEEER